MELSSWETVSRSGTQEFPNISWNPNVHYSGHNRPPPVSILSQIKSDGFRIWSYKYWIKSRGLPTREGILDWGLSVENVTLQRKKKTACHEMSHRAWGRAIAQAVSRWFPTSAARVRAWVWQVWFVVDKVELGQVFSEYFGFPCQSSFHQILHHHNHPGQVQ
jgi:hypothetical protein